MIKNNLRDSIIEVIKNYGPINSKAIAKILEVPYTQVDYKLYNGDNRLINNLVSVKMGQGTARFFITPPIIRMGTNVD